MPSVRDPYSYGGPGATPGPTVKVWMGEGAASEHTCVRRLFSYVFCPVSFFDAGLLRACGTMADFERSERSPVFLTDDSRNIPALLSVEAGRMHFWTDPWLRWARDCRKIRCLLKADNVQYSSVRTLQLLRSPFYKKTFCRISRRQDVSFCRIQPLQSSSMQSKMPDQKSSCSVGKMTSLHTPLF